MKPPISYYGGKQNMLVHLLPLIPSHQTYVEPFFGGGALFFAKNPAPLEVINDTNELLINLQDVQIDCQDALKVIRLYDSESTLFYCDPPYYNSDCGHYKGYTEADYKELIDLLLTIKGKFILSSYPNRVINALEWIHRDDIPMNRAVNAAKGATKTETIITNYLTPQLNLF